MGKVKNKKYKTKAVNPVGIPTVKEVELDYEIPTPESFNAGAKASLIEKLHSKRVEDRECAAVTLAKWAYKKDLVAALIGAKIIKIVSPLLIDKSLAVRHAVSGCLRNMAVCGDYTVSEAMVEQDIMTSLVMLFEEYKDPWTLSKTNDGRIDSKQAIFLEACNLLWTLCENSDLAVSIFNKRNLSSVLLPCLNIEAYGLDVPSAVAQCLYTVSENNNNLREVMRQPIVELQLRALMALPPADPQHILLKTLAAGMQLNMFYGQLDNCMSDVTTSILEVISTTLSSPINNALELLCKHILSHKAEKDNKFHDEKELEEKFVAVQKIQENTVHLLSAKQTAIEILGNMFDDNDDESQWEYVSSSDSGEEVLDHCNMDIDATNVTAKEIGLGLPVEIHSIIVTGNMLDKVTEQIVIPVDDIVKVLQSHLGAKGCLKRLETVRCTAILCLNNIIQKLSVADLGGPSKLLELWLNLGNLLFKKTDITDVEQVEAVTRSMGAVMRKLVQANCSSQFSHMTESDLEMLINICRQSPDSRIKVHIIQVLGSIGILLRSLNTPTSTNLIKIIGSVLLEICSKNTDMWVMAEALDAIMDVFGEDDTDSIIEELSLIERLSNILRTLKGKIKQQRKVLGEHLPVIMTVKENLLRFVNYHKYEKKKNIL